MDLGLQDKVAWVLGASSGIGRACAESLAIEGAAVALSARSADTLQAAAKEMGAANGGRALAVPLDVTDPEAIVPAAESVVSELGGIDILVANAGGPPSGTFDDLGDDELTGAFTLTTASAWRLVKAALPSMRERGGGAVVFITSASTKEVIPGLLLSNMMRAAVLGLAKTISKELAADGVRALCVAPGRIATDRLEELNEATARRTGSTVEQVRADTVARIPLGRLGDPRELGDVVAFLASERASYVSGVTVVVDGAALNTVQS